MCACVPVCLCVFPCAWVCILVWFGNGNAMHVVRPGQYVSLLSFIYEWHTDSNAATIQQTGTDRWHIFINFIFIRTIRKLVIALYYLFCLHPLRVHIFHMHNFNWSKLLWGLSLNGVFFSLSPTVVWGNPLTVIGIINWWWWWWSLWTYSVQFIKYLSSHQCFSICILESVIMSCCFPQ